MKNFGKIKFLFGLMVCICMPINSMKRGRDENVPPQQAPTKRGKQQREKRGAEAELTGQPEQKRVKTETIIKTSEQDFKTPTELQDEETVTLISKDGNEFIVPIILAEQNATLKELIEDTGTDSPLVIPSINSKTLATFISLNTALYPLLKANNQIELFNERAQPANHKRLTYIPRAYQPLANKIIQNKTIQELILLINAANHLDNKFILNAMSAAIADHIKKTTPAPLPRMVSDSARFREEPGLFPEEKTKQAKIRLSVFLRINRLNLIASLQQYILRHLTFRELGITQEYSIADYITDNGIPKAQEKESFEEQLMKECIDISEKKITSLFGINYIQQHKAIKQLDISKTYFYLIKLDVQKSMLEKLNQLEWLELVGSELNQIPPNIFSGLSKVTILNLQENNLTQLEPNSFAGLNNLKELNLPGNNLTQLKPNCFAGLNNLTELDLQAVHLKQLEANSFAGLNNLKKLYLANNDLKQLKPGIFAGLGNLQQLWLEANADLKELKPGTFAGLANLEELYLGENKLTELKPGTFAGLANLEFLSLDNSQLDKLAPDIFAGLVNLQVLYLSTNKLTELKPGTFAGLANLEALRLGGNQLDKLTPDIFAGLANLEKLHLSQNKLTELKPGTFAGLGNLQYLNLEDNQLHKLAPDIFAGLVNLRVLYLRKNKLTEENKNKLRQALPNVDIEF